MAIIRLTTVYNNYLCLLHKINSLLESLHCYTIWLPEDSSHIDYAHVAGPNFDFYSRFKFFDFLILIWKNHHALIFIFFYLLFNYKKDFTHQHAFHNLIIGISLLVWVCQNKTSQLQHDFLTPKHWDGLLMCILNGKWLVVHAQYASFLSLAHLTWVGFRVCRQLKVISDLCFWANSKAQSSCPSHNSITLQLLHCYKKEKWGALISIKK